MGNDGYCDCECQIPIQNMNRLKASGLEGVVKRYTFESYKADKPFQKHIFQTAKDYINNYDNESWFFVGGQSGIGKTHICTAIAYNIMTVQKKRLRYETANEFLHELKLSAMDEINYHRIYGRLTETPVLYIDDLFKSVRTTDADARIIFNLINDRYLKKKVTIISSEKTITDIENAHMDLVAVAGRIIERSGEYLINVSQDNKKNFRKSKFLER